MRHDNMQIVLEIYYTPNSMNLWTRIKEELNTGGKKRKIKTSGRNFNLANDFTEKILIKCIKKIHNERFNTDDV